MAVLHTKVKRVGGSIVLAVPPREARALGLREGQSVAVIVPAKELAAIGAYRNYPLNPDQEDDEDLDLEE